MIFTDALVDLEFSRMNLGLETSQNSFLKSWVSVLMLEVRVLVSVLVLEVKSLGIGPKQANLESKAE